VVEANAANPDRRLRIGFLGPQTGFHLAAGETLPVDLDVVFLLELLEKLLGKRFLKSRVGTDGGLAKSQGG